MENMHTDVKMKRVKRTEGLGFFSSRVARKFSGDERSWVRVFLCAFVMAQCGAHYAACGDGTNRGNNFFAYFFSLFFLFFFFR